MRSLSSRIPFLLQFVNIPPEAWDFIFPHGPVFKSIAIREHILSTLVRDIAVQVSDKELAGKVKAAGVEMVKFSAANLVNGWEDGDDLCPPYPPFPWPWWNDAFQERFKTQPVQWFSQGLAELNPQPLPPKALASGLKLIGKLTTAPKVADQLNDLAKRVGRLQA